MVVKDYSDEFKADAVALYESTPGAPYKSTAADLGVNRATLREGVPRDRERRGVTAAAAKPGGPPREAVPSADPDERVRQLQARVAEFEASERKLATERDILRKGGQVFRRRDELVRSRFQFVDDHRDTHEVERLCQVLDVNRSSYCKWLAGAEARAARQHKDRIPAEEIREVHGESEGPGTLARQDRWTVLSKPRGESSGARAEVRDPANSPAYSGLTKRGALRRDHVLCEGDPGGEGAGGTAGASSWSCWLPSRVVARSLTCGPGRVGGWYWSVRDSYDLLDGVRLVHHGEHVVGDVGAWHGESAPDVAVPRCPVRAGQRLVGELGRA